MVGGILGLLVGLVVAIVLSLLDRTVRTARQVADLTGQPMLGFVPRPKRGQVGQAAFRKIRTRVFYGRREASRVAVCATDDVRDAAMVAANLARSFTELGVSTVVVDLLPGESGLRDELAAVDRVAVGAGVGSGAHVAHQVLATDVSGLGYLPADAISIAGPDLPALGLYADQMFEDLGSVYDTVLLAVPSPQQSSDGGVAGALAHGVLLVARYGSTKLGDLEGAATTISEVQGRLTGTVVIGVPDHAGRSGMSG
ncbi:MAG: hypothetical protein WAX14_01210 [Rhodococcus sp. (in: high G+C Gram-positive bacteria)]|uniref:hypothetical protein n=1 Tax=Rhodococcus sp. TaxID=1831 RepID=UPI003BB6CB26